MCEQNDMKEDEFETQKDAIEEQNDMKEDEFESQKDAIEEQKLEMNCSLWDETDRYWNNI